MDDTELAARRQLGKPLCHPNMGACRLRRMFRVFQSIPAKVEAANGADSFYFGQSRGPAVP